MSHEISHDDFKSFTECHPKPTGKFESMPTSIRITSEKALEDPFHENINLNNQIPKAFLEDDQNDQAKMNLNIPLNEDQEEGAPANAEEENDSEDEGIEDYKIGGYHPVHVGYVNKKKPLGKAKANAEIKSPSEVLLERYVIIQKLGWGHFSTVWLSRDFKYDTYVAIKIQKSAPHYLEAAYDEVEILQKIARNTSNPEWIKSLREYLAPNQHFNRDHCQVVQLLNSFIYKGPYGNHFCMVFEILGVNLLEIIKRYNYKGVPLHLCRTIAKQILIGLDFLHRFSQVIHTDLKPENILVCLTQEEIKDIVENGQLTQNQKFIERIKEYQKAHNIENPEENFYESKEKLRRELSEKRRAAAASESLLQSKNKENENNEAKKENEEEPKKKGLTKTQKKNKKRKENKKKKKDMINKESKNEEEQAENKPADQPSSAMDVPKSVQPSEEVQTSAKEHGGITGKEQPAASQEPQVKENPKRNMFDTLSTRGPLIDERIKVKIADLGNACWIHHHFATEIQTRQYRSPEVILGIHYDTSADIWSFACTLFEMLTGDFLFEPRKGPNFSKDDDHLAQMEEMLKKMPVDFSLTGKYSKKFLDSKGNLRRIPDLHYWPLKNILIEKYHIKEREAKAFAEFLHPMLNYYPRKRATAQECLRSPWFNSEIREDYKMTDYELQLYLKKKQLLADDEVDVSCNEAQESEINDGDSEDNNEMPFQNMENDDEFFKNYRPKLDTRLIDRSFTNLGYIGYGDGIQIDELDTTANWQFDAYK